MELTFAQESIKRYGKKPSYSGGRCMAQHEVCKKDQKRKKKRYDLTPKPVEVIQGGEVGRRTSRIDSLLAREQAAKGRVKMNLKRKTDKSLRNFGQGKTKGKQKDKGHTIVPKFYNEETKQCEFPPSSAYRVEQTQGLDVYSKS